MAGLNMDSKITIRNSLDMEVIINGAKKERRHKKSLRNALLKARLVQVILREEDNVQANNAFRYAIFWHFRGRSQSPMIFQESVKRRHMPVDIRPRM